MLLIINFISNYWIVILTGTVQPPSEMIWPPKPCAESAHSMTAESCGYPTPVCFLVVQTLPGPIPTLTISAPERINSFLNKIKIKIKIKKERNNNDISIMIYLLIIISLYCI